MLISLEGYSLEATSVAPYGTASLGLYWRPIGDPTRALKVFVHLRDGLALTIAQADHFILDQLLISSEWNRLREGANGCVTPLMYGVLCLCQLMANRIEFTVGLYDPETFERVPVLDDTSGENAVVFDLSGLL